jgi:hypothetical protein
MVNGGVDDGAVEEEDAVFLATQMLGHLGGVGVEADTEERFSFSYQGNEFGSCHGFLF